jgi:hypothetical protein
MSAVDAGVSFLQRYTTLVGEYADFTTAPLDCSRMGGVQFQVWRGPIRTTGGDSSLTLYLEESLDAHTWVLGPSTPQGIVLGEEQTRFFSYAFRLRWFRLRFHLAGNDPMVSCWAEGLLRGGDGGAWALPPAGKSDAAGLLDARPAPAPLDLEARHRLLLAPMVAAQNSAGQIAFVKDGTPGWTALDRPLNFAMPTDPFDPFGP